MKTLSARFVLVMSAFPSAHHLAFAQTEINLDAQPVMERADSVEGSSAPVSAQGPPPKRKKPVFNKGFLRGTGAANIDLDDLLNSGVLPGVYDVSVALNGRQVTNKTLSFDKNIRTGLVEACISIELLDQIGVDTERLYQQGLLTKNAVSECIDLEMVMEKASQSYDSERFRLSLSIPQLYLRENAEIFASPDLWEYGVNAAMTQYSATFNQQWNLEQSESSYSATASLRNRINLLGWRIHNAGSLTMRNEGGFQYSSFTLYAEHDVDFLKSQFRVGDVYASANGLDGFGLRGVQLTDDLAMRPGARRQLRPSVRGRAETSAVIEIRQRGFLILTTNVPPGAFELTDIPNVSADGDLEVTVIEADGRRLVTIQPWITGVEILTPGFFTYEAAAGQYNSYTSTSVRKLNAYSASYSYGVNTWLSIHGGIQATQGYYAKALSVASATPIGPVSIDLKYFNSKIKDVSLSGNGVGVSYSRNLTQYGFSFSASTQRFSSSGFRSLSAHASQFVGGDTAEPERPLKQTYSISITKNWENSRWGNFFGTWVQSSFWGDNYKVSSVNLGYRNTFRQLSYSLTGTYAKNVTPIGKNAESSRQLLFNVSIPLGTEKYPIRMNLAYSTRAGFSSAQSLSKQGEFNLDGQRYNYTAYVNGSHKRLDGVGANISTTTSAANYFAAISGSSSSASLNLGASGGIVLHAGGLNFTRSASDTLVLVKVPGQKGVQVGGSTTGYNGYTVVPASPYQFNQVLIGKNLDPNVDLTQDIGITVVPRRDAIVPAYFDIVKGRRVEFKISLPNGERLPFGAVLIDKEGKRAGVSDPFGRALVLVKENEGTLQVKWDNNLCRFPYQLAEAEQELNFERVAVVCENESTSQNN